MVKSEKGFGWFLLAMMMNNGEEDELYEQLWKACAGPHVEVPRAGQRVFYFPQGHMEQVCFRSFAIFVFVES